VTRIPQAVEGWVVPDVPGVHPWAEMETAARLGLPVVLQPGTVERLIAEVVHLRAAARVDIELDRGVPD
jgi:hypothetical protein